MSSLFQNTESKQILDILESTKNAEIDNCQAIGVITKISKSLTQKFTEKETTEIIAVITHISIETAQILFNVLKPFLALTLAVVTEYLSTLLQEMTDENIIDFEIIDDINKFNIMLLSNLNMDVIYSIIPVLTKFHEQKISEKEAETKDYFIYVRDIQIEMLNSLKEQFVKA